MFLTVSSVIICAFGLTDSIVVSLTTRTRGLDSSYGIPTHGVWNRHTPWGGMVREVRSCMVHGVIRVVLWDFVLIPLRDKNEVPQ